MVVYVLMAQDGHRDYFETWEPIAVFQGKPSTIDVGRVLVTSQEIPWGHGDAWADADKPRRIMDYCKVIAVPVVQP